MGDTSKQQRPAEAPKRGEAAWEQAQRDRLAAEHERAGRTIAQLPADAAAPAGSPATSDAARTVAAANVRIMAIPLSSGAAH